MARVITGGADTFNVYAYGEQHPETLKFMDSQIQKVSSMIGRVSDSFISKANALYERFSGEDAVRRAKAILRSATSIFQKDIIKELSTINDFQTAQPLMQRWIMANPEVRKMYHEQRCDGYSHSYVDAQPNEIGESHRDYRLVKNGMVDFNDDGSWSYTNYYEPLEEGERELDIVDQSRILSAWNHIEAILKLKGEDPTSVYGDKL